MNFDFFKKFDGKPTAIFGIIILGGIAWYGFYTYNNFEGERIRLLAELESAREGNYELLLQVRERENIIESFTGQISNIGSKVGTLEKLAKTDKELLMKYSKVYFLNENYVPAKLVQIDKMYLNNGATNIEIHADVWPYLEKLLMAANQAGIKLRVASAYRSFSTQSTLKNSYTVLYGSGANRFSADQGYSEHQLGTAVDFTTENLGAVFSSFGSDQGFEWLKKNAYKYGFILSYPPDNAYYKFEPWHWRYVGVPLAAKLHADGKYFYDLEQREIDEYLIKLFP